MNPAHESEVLKPLDPAIKDDENAWPQFPLRDVTVYSQETRQPISLLAAHKTGKVRVVGMLHDQDADKEVRKRFKKRFQKQQHVYIRDVDMYSYGKYDDDSLAFWAAGQAGWFELRTQAVGYRETYAQMEEATEMLYYLVGKAVRQRKDFRKATEKQVKDTMSHVFSDFIASDHNKRRKDPQDAIEGFSEHRSFLIKCMLEGAEGVDWTNTPSLRWFAKSFPRDLAVIQDVVNQTNSASIENLEDQPDPVPIKSHRRSTSDEEMTGNEPTVGRRSRRLAAVAEDEDNSSEELSNRRSRTRGKHKRKSMLRIPGSAKTPKKSNVKRYDGLRSIPMPDMDYFGDQTKQEMDGVEYEDEVPEEDEISQGLVHDLKFSELDGEEEEEEQATPIDSYWEVKGPNDTWSCPYDGCNHTIWDASTPTGKALIKTHYSQTHQDSIEELIKSESRPWAKTSYLLEKVRSMQAQGAAVSKNGAATTVVGKKEHGQEEVEFPRPIRRKV